MRDLKGFFQPQSIAIIGASQNFKSINGMLVKYLLKHGYSGKIFPINPRYQEIAGYKCYPSLLEVNEPVDLVLIAISSDKVLGVLEECAARNVKAVIVYSSGFAETGDSGKEVQEKISELSREKGMAICGPNCLGAANFLDNMVAAFSPVLDEELIKGPVSFISQSGAFGWVTFHQAQVEEGLGFSYLITTGNEADLNTADFIEYLAEDERSKVILCYMEGIKEGELFKKAAEKALHADKPIVALKVGRSEVGQRAIASHTAALAGSDAILDAFFKQKVITRAEHSDDLIDMAKIFLNKRRPKGNRVGILTTSGGAGIMAADTFTSYGLEIPQLDSSSRREIEKVIPAFGSSVNPVDVTAQVLNAPEYLTLCLQAVINDKNVDCMMISLSTVGGDLGVAIAKGIVQVYQATDKPIAVSWGASAKHAEGAFAVLKEAKVPLYKQPVRCAQALSKLVLYAEARSKCLSEEVRSVSEEEVSSIWDTVADIPGKVLSEYHAKRLLSKMDIPVTREALVTREDQLAAALETTSYPVALKVMSPKLLHKTEAGVVALNIGNEEELKEKYREIMGNALKSVNPLDIEGVLVQEMAKPGIEVIIGVKNDPQFGPTIMFGLGGVFVEVLKDVVFRVAPLSKKDALDMIKEIKGSKLLDGFRGMPGADKKMLVELLLNVSNLAYSLRDKVAEIDLNPVILNSDGIKIVDALIIKKE